MTFAGRVGWAGLLALVALALGTVSAPPASAHAGLVSSTPADGAVLRTPPRQVTLVFTESVQLDFSRVAVSGPSGAAVASGDPTAAGARVVQPVSITSAGGHTVTYRIVSRDGHVVQGRLRFTVTASPAGSPAATSSAAVGSTPSATPGSALSTASSPSVVGAPAQRSWSGWGSPLVLVPMLLALMGVTVLLAVKPRRRVPDADEQPDDSGPQQSVTESTSGSVAADRAANRDTPT